MTGSVSGSESAVLDLKDRFIAPWGLANEELPMHLIWDGEVDKIIVKYPQDLDAVSAYNVDEGEMDTQSDSGITELSVSEKSLTTEGYFGIVFSCPATYDDSIVRHNISVIFYKNESAVADWSACTHIIRPQIKFVKYPEKIVLSDKDEPEIGEGEFLLNVNEKNNSIEVDLEYVGFGMAKVRMDARAEGNLISKEDSIYHDFVEAIIESEIHLQDIDDLEKIPEEWVVNSGYEIPHEEIEDIVRETREIVTDESLTQKYDSEDLFRLADILESAQKSAESGSGPSIYQYIETMLLTSIMNVVDRHPTENVSLEKPNVKIETEARATEITLECNLKDSMNNKYDPAQIEMKVDDRRQEGGVFEAELITNWENYQIDPDEVFG